jgi:hypothetical protein
MALIGLSEPFGFYLSLGPGADSLPRDRRNARHRRKRRSDDDGLAILIFRTRATTLRAARRGHTGVPQGFEGEVIGVIGPSGAGKSTLLRIVNQPERQQSGVLMVEGERIDPHWSNRRLARLWAKIGMVLRPRSRSGRS